LEVDVTNKQQLIDSIKGHDLVINTIGPFSKYAIPVMKAAINSKVNYIDICDDIEPTIEALQLNQFAKNSNIFILLNMGWFPGMSNLRAIALAREMDDVEEIITAWVAGRKSPEEHPSLGLAGTEHYFEGLTGKILSFRNGQRVRIPIDHKGVKLTFPKPLGTITCYQMEHPEVATLPYSIPGLKNATNLMSLYPSNRNNFIRLLAKAVDLKLFSLSMVTKISAILGKSKKKRFLPVLIGEYIACIGTKDGKRGQLSFSAVNKKLTVAEATSQPLACAVLYLTSDGKIDPGVHLAENALKLEDIVEYGEKLNLPFVKDHKEKITWSEEIISITRGYH
jgi:saccharopine dehydrogenase-like NADP-dependent oxidoreductase